MTSQCHLPPANSEMLHVDHSSSDLLHGVKVVVESEVTVHSASHPASLQVNTSSDASCAQSSVSSRSPQCPSCPLVFRTLCGLAKHFKTVHLDVQLFKCTHCQSEVSGGYDAYLSHWRAHSVPERRQKGRKIQHENKGIRECPTCHEVVQAKCYTRHLSLHKWATCTVCNRQVMSRNLKRHINYMHTRETKYSCADCPAVYFDASNLMHHRKRLHMGQEIKKHLCEVCGKKFLQPCDLRTHVDKVHPKVRKYVCEYCGLDYKTSSSLMYHRRSHTGEKPHTCHVCKKSFAKPSALAKHIRCVHHLEYQGKYKKWLRVTHSRIQTKPSQTDLSQAISSQTTQSQDTCKSKVVHVLQMDVSQVQTRSCNTANKVLEDDKREAAQDPEFHITPELQLMSQSEIPLKILSQDEESDVHEIKVISPAASSSQPLSGSTVWCRPFHSSCDDDDDDAVSGSP